MIKLTRIDIENYKCFKSKQENIELTPITLIFGNNSSGKSAFLKLFKVIGTPFLERNELSALNVQGFNNSLEPTIIHWTFSDQMSPAQEIEFTWISYPDEKELKDKERDEVKIQFRRKNPNFEITKGVFIPKKLPAIVDSTLEFDTKELKGAIKEVFTSLPEYLNPTLLKKTTREKVFKWLTDHLLICPVEHSAREILFDERKFADEIKRKYTGFSLHQKNVNDHLDLLMPYFIDRCIDHEISPFIHHINTVIQNYNQQVNYLPAFRYRPINHYNGKEFRKLFGEDFINHILLKDIGDENNGDIVQIESFDLFEYLRDQNMKNPATGSKANEEPVKEKVIKKEVGAYHVDEAENIANVESESAMDGIEEDSEEGNSDRNQETNFDIDSRTEEEFEFTPQKLYEVTHDKKDAISVLFNLMYELGYPDYDIVIKRILFDNDEIFKMFIKQGLESNIQRELTDVGFGISQIIPVLIGIAWNKGLLVVEEPEQHLHPRAQLNLSRATFRLYLDNIRKGNYIFETHSQILVESFLKEINAGKLNSEDISIYYIDQKDGESFIQRIRIYEDGAMDNWPHGYFTEIDEILGLL